MNLAQKTTVHIENKKVPVVNIPQDTLRLISDISSDISRSVNLHMHELIPTIYPCIK